MKDRIEEILKNSPEARRQMDEAIKGLNSDMKEKSIEKDYDISPQHTPNKNIKENSDAPNFNGEALGVKEQKIDAVEKALNKTQEEKDQTKQQEAEKSKDPEKEK